MAAFMTESLLRSIGMFDQKANKPKLDARSLDMFARRQLAFEWAHMGNSEIRVGDLMAVLRSTPLLAPPRTGHVGNWGSIACGRAGPRDYNYLICGPNCLGYPMLLDINQTESDATGSGDWVYLPGSFIQEGERKILDLFTWDGTAFVRRHREESYFTPFTLAAVQGALVPLTELHMQACAQYGDFRFRRQSPLLVEQEPLVRQILLILLEDAIAQERPEQILKRIIDRSATVDGRVIRVAPERHHRGIRLGDICYATLNEVVDHTMLAIHMAAQPGDFVENVRTLPRQLPVVSAPLLVLLLAVLHTHYPDAQVVTSEMTHPCNPHLHWGGTSMAGSPPHYRGYFADSSRHLRKLFQSVIRHIDEIDPILFVLLPAPIFNLCAHTGFPRDVELVASLVGQVHRETGHLVGRPDDMRPVIDRLAENWRSETRSTLSGYFLSRLAPLPGSIASFPVPTEGRPILTDEFAALTLQQASMVVGALHRIRLSELNRIN